MREQLGENLYEKASREFSIDATVGKQLEIYQTILRRTARAKEKRRGVLICGAYGKGNAGDDAILKAILAQMRHIDPDMPIYVLSHNPKQTRLRYHVGSVHAFDPFAFLPIMRRTKLFLSGGGSLIQDETSTRSLHYYLMSIRLAKRCGNKVLMYGCGIGPVHSASNRRHAAKVIDRCVDAITLREDLSAEELRSMGLPQLLNTRSLASPLSPPTNLLSVAPSNFATLLTSFATSTLRDASDTVKPAVTFLSSSFSNSTIRSYPNRRTLLLLRSNLKVKAKFQPTH